MTNNNYVAIMAGGIGSRFWPMSRTDFPKQFLDILNTGRTLIQGTFDRFALFIPIEKQVMTEGITIIIAIVFHEVAVAPAGIVY